MADTVLVSAPWATEADLPEDATPPPAPWTWPDLLQVASELLYELSGRQWRGQSTSRVQVVGAGQNSRLVPGWVPAAIGTGPDGAAPLVGGRGTGPVVVRLPSSPATSATVTLDGQALDDTRWSLAAGTGLLERTDGNPWPVDGTLLVEYTSGIAPPVAGRMYAVALAVELAKVTPGSAGSLDARLANVVTSLTREAVTVQMEPVAINLREAITSGKTGLAEIDLWLTSVNPYRMRRRARVYSPDLGRTRRAPAS